MEGQTVKRLTLNREFAVRHIGVALLMAGLGCWFAYDGFVDYPQRDDAWFESQHLRRDNAIRRQKEFMFLAFLASIAIAGHVAAVARLRVSYDDGGFEHDGVRTAYADAKDVDWSKWEKKGIVKVGRLVLDAWHHSGVRDIASRLPGFKSGT